MDSIMVRRSELADTVQCLTSALCNSLEEVTGIPAGFLQTRTLAEVIPHGDEEYEVLPARLTEDGMAALSQYLSSEPSMTLGTPLPMGEPSEIDLFGDLSPQEEAELEAEAEAAMRESHVAE